MKHGAECGSTASPRVHFPARGSALRAVAGKYAAFLPPGQNAVPLLRPRNSADGEDPLIRTKYQNDANNILDAAGLATQTALGRGLHSKKRASKTAHYCWGKHGRQLAQ